MATTLTTALARTLLLTLFGMFLSASLYAQKSGPSVAIKIILTGTVPGSTVLSPPHEKPGKQAVTYPKDAAREGVGGTVKLKLLVDTEGNIKESHVIENGGDKRLLRATVEGLRTTGLTAGTVDKKPTEMWVTVEATFNPGKKNESLAPGKESKEDHDEIMYADIAEIEYASAAPMDDAEDDFIPDATPPSYDQAELSRLLEYPVIARENGIEGTVKVSVQVDKDGTPLQVRIMHSTNKIFEQNARKAASELTYTPATQNGHPIQTWFTLTVAFELTDNLTEREATEEEIEYDIDDFVPQATPPSYDLEELKRLLKYPPKAQQNAITGEVIVGAQIGKDGKVLQVIVRHSTHDIFEESAKEAVRKLTFTPAIQDGEPIKMWITISIRFELE